MLAWASIGWYKWGPLGRALWAQRAMGWRGFSGPFWTPRETLG